MNVMFVFTPPSHDDMRGYVRYAYCERGTPRRFSVLHVRLGGFAPAHRLKPPCTMNQSLFPGRTGQGFAGFWLSIHNSNSLGPGTPSRKRGRAINQQCQLPVSVLGSTFNELTRVARLFLQRPIQGPDIIRSQCGNPSSFLFDHDALGKPRRTDILRGGALITAIAAKGEFVHVKYHFIANHSQKQFIQDKAIAYIQVINPRETSSEDLAFDPFNVTKVWPRNQFSMREFDRLVLNKNLENVHRDME
ncbi:catalase domain-containing protein [Hirsutella rhossiliensis]